MNKELLLTVLIVLTVALSVGTIYASDVNITDSYANTADDTYEISVSDSNVDNDSSNDNILESDNSDTLSTNSDSNSLSASDNNAEILSVANTTIDKSKTITSKDVTKYYKGSTKYTATFLDSYGNALANTNVKIKVNGVTYTKKTNSNGVASMSINLKPGSYKVVSTNPKTGFSLTTTFKILSTISAKDISKVYTDTKKFSATFYKSNGKVLAKKNVKFKINGKTYTRKTNAKGVASLSLTTLTKGTYKIISYNTDGLTKTNKVKVVKYTTTSLTASDYTFLKSKSKTIKVRLLHKLGYAPGKGKKITFKVNGKSYSANTDSKGYAKLKLPSLKEGVYTVTYKFGGNNFYKASSTKSKVTIIPSKTPTFTVKSTTKFGHGAGTAFKVALTSGSVPLAGKTVTLNVNEKSYTKTTDSSGIASLKIDLNVGNYNISYTNKADSNVNSKTGSTKISVVERTLTSLTWKSDASMYQGTRSVKVLLLDSKSKAISGATVKLTVGSKDYSAKTSSSGYATFSVSLPTVGDQTVKFSYGGDNLNAPSSGSKKVSVLRMTSISFKDILTASNTLKTYIENNNKLPSSVTAAGVKFTVPEFLYIMGKAIQEMGSSTKKDISIIYDVAAPKSPSGDTISSKQLVKDKYVAAAKSVADYISKNKQAPNYVSTAVGKIHYNEIVDAFSRILAFYKNNDNTQPNYVTINYPITSVIVTQSGSGLNEKNTIKSLIAYLKSSTNCQVNNSAIKKVVNSLTKGLTSDAAKAKAIYNYVRDSISYSFYYDTKHGAKGTLSAGSGNCVDQAHLVIAMFRTAGLAARYVHGTCTFSSGSTYGHVWAQVLINGKWTVADATSTRNSLGNVVNWNTNSYTVHGIYSGISF